MEQPGAAAKAPVTAHPAFPAIVALWFAALLGLGTMVMPAVVLEKVGALTGLTEAPLTAAARAAMALLATIAGLVIGLLLARRLSGHRTYERAPRRRTPSGTRRAAPPRPLSVHEDLGEDAIAPAGGESNTTVARRRRALTVPEDDRPSDLLDPAPLPGADLPAALDIPEQETAMSERPGPFVASPHDHEAEDAFELPPVEADTPEPVPSEPAAPAPYVPALDTRKPRPVTAPPAADAGEDARADAAPGPIDAPLDTLGMVQLAERLGRSMQRRLAERAAEPEPETQPLAAPDGDEVRVPPPVVPDALRAFMEPGDDGAPAQAAADASPAAPAIPRGFAFEDLVPDYEPADDDDAFDPHSLTLPLDAALPRPFAAPESAAETVAAEAGVEDEEEAEDALGEEGGSFSSLLSMKNPFRVPEEFVRIEEPETDDDAVEPAVVFPARDGPSGESAASATERPFDTPHVPAPSTAPPRPPIAHDPVETERALRSALANLQRMSGAA